MEAQQEGRCGVSMAYDIYDPPSGRSRRWGRRRSNQPGMPNWAGLLMVVLGASIVGTLAWVKVTGSLQKAGKSSGAGAAAPAVATAAAEAAPELWQRDATESLENAARQAGAGDITQAEVAVDRAAALVTAARVRAKSSTPAFFEMSVRQLDRIVARHPQNPRLAEHATQMRIELAQLRSRQETTWPPAGGRNRVAINAPRAIARDTKLDAESLGGNFLDATLMPSSAEILEPPSSRLFVDNVRVEDLTIAGATQTLDGLQWKNVTFIGTRLRYEGGEVDLQNAHFVRCTFGFISNDRGARLATAVALGQTSFVIE